MLRREYGPYITSPEAGYDFSVLLDLENLPSDQGTYIITAESPLSQANVILGERAERTWYVEYRS